MKKNIKFIITLEGNLGYWPDKKHVKNGNDETVLLMSSKSGWYVGTGYPNIGFYTRKVGRETVKRLMCDCIFAGAFYYSIWKVEIDPDTNEIVKWIKKNP